ncbi:hypothetical protein LCGC14_1117060, partial [marine sediment metagenome]
MLNKIKSELLNFGLKFISVEEKIVRMILETKPSNLNEIVILPAVKIVMEKLLKKLQNKRIYGRVYNGELNNVRVSIVRSLIGAPNCAIAIEALKRTKTKVIIRIDFCGGIGGEDLPIDVGHIMIPKLAYCDDGTCPQYIREFPSLANELESIPHPMMKFQNLLTGNRSVYISKPHDTLKDLFLSEGVSLFPNIVKESNLWTTDALFCEGLDFIRALNSIKISSIDMESSILFLLGKLYNLKTVSVLSVSDLPGHPKFDLQNSNEIHPNMENGIDNVIKLLIKALPKVKRNV